MSFQWPGPAILFVPRLREADARHARPRVGDVAGDAPQIAADVGAPRPHVAPSILAERKNEVAIELVERGAHHVVRLLESRKTVAIRLDVGVRAPVVLDVVEAPLRPRLRVLRLVLVAPGVSLLAGPWPRRGINADLESFAVDVVGEGFHVGEFLVRRDLAVRVARAFPGVVDVDVRVALCGEPARYERVRGGADPRIVDHARPTRSTSSSRAAA